MKSSVWLHLGTTFVSQTKGFEASRGQFLGFYEAKVKMSPKLFQNGSLETSGRPWGAEAVF